MELLAEASLLSHWLLDYGCITLFILLSLGIVALPIPEETLMVMAGVLMHQGKLNILQTFLCAYSGSILGISLSYVLGRTAGTFLIQKFGKWLGITPERMEKGQLWFEKFGKWLLVIGYFIPGVRHFTGFSAGIAKMHYGHFSLFAYSGAILWSSLFLSVGYYLGPYCVAWLENLEMADMFIFGAALIAFVMLIVWLRGRSKTRSSKKVSEL